MLIFILCILCLIFMFVALFVVFFMILLTLTIAIRMMLLLLVLVKVLTVIIANRIWMMQCVHIRVSVCPLFKILNILFIVVLVQWMIASHGGWLNQTVNIIQWIL